MSRTVPAYLGVAPLGDGDGTVREADLLLGAAALGTEPTANVIVDWNSERVVDVRGVALVASKLGRSVEYTSSKERQARRLPRTVVVGQKAIE